MKYVYTEHKLKKSVTVIELRSEKIFLFRPEKAMKEVGHAEQIEKAIYNWLKERKFDKTHLAEGGDSQNLICKNILYGWFVYFIPIDSH